MPEPNKLSSLKPIPKPNPVSPENDPPTKKFPVFLFSLIFISKSIDESGFLVLLKDTLLIYFNFEINSLFSRWPHDGPRWR